MKAEEIRDLWVQIWADMDINIEPVDEEELKAVTKFAELSYKVGYDKALAQLAEMTEECKQMGRREVVEFIEKRCAGSTKAYDEEWIKQLGEWGI